MLMHHIHGYSLGENISTLYNQQEQYQHYIKHFYKSKAKDKQSNQKNGQRI